MKKRYVFIVLVLIFSEIIFALKIPKLTGRVNDYAEILNSTQEKEITALLFSQEHKTSSQFVLLTVPTLKGGSLEDYSIKVADSWKIGQKGLDNGVLLLISIAEKKIRIEVGYGLESILTDMKCGYIIRNIIVPHFKRGNYYDGIYSGLQAITGIVTNEFDISPEELAKYQARKRKVKTSQLPIGIVVFIIMIVLSSFKRTLRGRSGLFPLLFLGGLGSRGGSGFGGGGFGGFSGGGGGFGGGGASGGW
ncbi:MAG: hypothetical protein DRJ01_14565 [Bacteroidetes bacterium]|nr:MAG: hypothetical protein DRJ01_14565 [Bacteroidota bacterium]